MNGWKIVPLSKVCSIDKNKHDGSSLPYVGMEDIEGGTGNFLGSRTPQTVQSSTFSFTPKHLLYGRLRPYLNKVMLPDFSGHCSSEIFPILVSSSLERSFLFYWLINEKTVEKINRTCTGARMPRANVKEVLKFDFPLPPLSEQKRIVEILDKAFEGIDRAIANTQKNLANARELFDSYLNNIFDIKGDKWETKQLKLEDILQKTETINPKQYPDSDFEYIDISGVCNKKFVIEKTSNFKGKDAPSRARRLVKKDDILFATVRPTLKRITAIPSHLDGQVCSTGFFVLRPKDFINSKFLFYFLFSKNFIDSMASLQKGASYPAVNDGDVKNQFIFFPPLSEQKRIVEKLDQLLTQTQRLETIYQRKLEALQELKQSLLHKAFTGELTNPSTSLRNNPTVKEVAA